MPKVNDETIAAYIALGVGGLGCQGAVAAYDEDHTRLSLRPF